MWLFYALLSALFASLTAILAKAGLKNVDADLATAIRTVIIFILTWSVVLFKGSSLSWSTLSKNNILFLCLSGVATGLSWMFYYRALQIGKVAQVASVDKLSLALTIILSVIFLHESLTVKTGIGALFIIIGVLVISY